MELNQHSIKLALCKIALSGAIGGLAIVGAWQGGKIASEAILAKYSEARAALVARFSRVEVKEVVRDAEAQPLTALIKSISHEQGINPIITWAIVERESNFNPAAIRFEDGMMPKNADPQTRMKYSSHGLMQVMGFNAAKCGLQWNELYDRAKNLRCGLSILRANLKSAKGKTPAERLRVALRMYNGRGPAAENYSDAVMGAIADALLQNLGEGV